MPLTREQFLGAARFPTEKVDVPELGDCVYVRSIQSDERDAYEQSLQQRRGRDYVQNFNGARARLVALCASDEQGNRLFTDNDVPALSKFPAAPMDRVFEAAMRLNRLTRQTRNGVVSSA
jgi:hypothetical protein